MESKQFNIPEGYNIPYYDKQKRTFGQTIIKIRNTILGSLAFHCPFNIIRIQFHRWRGVHIGKEVYIGRYCFIDNYDPAYIYIENKASINAESMILTHFNPSEHMAAISPARVEPVLIKEGASVSVRCIVLPGVVIGKNAIISAGSVVDKSVPDCTLVRGNPAKKVLDYNFLFLNNDK